MVHFSFKLFKTGLLFSILLLVQELPGQNIKWALTSNSTALVTGVTNVTPNAQTQGTNISTVKYTTNGVSATGYNGTPGSTCQPNAEDSLSFSFSVNTGVKVISSVAFTHRRVSGTSSNCCWQLFVKVGTGTLQTINANTATNSGSNTAIFDITTNPAIFPISVNSGTTVYFTLRGDASNSTDSLAVKDFTLNFCNINFTATPTQPLCFGDFGSVALNASGGTTPYTFGGDATSNLAPGTYNYTVVDNVGCTGTASTTINPAPSQLGLTDSTTQPLCFGQKGSVTLTANGGTGTKQYSKDGGSTFQSSPTFNNLSAGNYPFVVKDANNCTFTLIPNIIINSAPSAISANATVTSNYNGAQIRCVNSTDGEITVNNASGGAGSYSYSLNGGTFQSSNIFTNLGSGSYDIIVKDANGCQDTITPPVVITPPAPINITSSVDSVKCNGDNTGSITLTSVSGGTHGVPPYTFFWSNSATTQNISSLTAGSYTVTVSDGNGCTKNSTFTVLEPLKLRFSTPNINITNVECEGDSTGGISNSTIGGTPGYTYLWDTGETTEDITGLLAGLHTVTITDSNGCTFDTTFNVGITNFKSQTPTALTASDTVICSGESVTFDVTGNLGTLGAFKWYENSCGSGTAIGSGHTLILQLDNTTTSPIVKTLFVRAEDSIPCAFNTSCRSISITVNPVPKLTSVDSLIICSGEPLGYQIQSDIPSDMTFGWTPTTVPAGISDTSSQVAATNEILNDALVNNSFTIPRTVIYTLDLVYTKNGIQCAIDTPLVVKVNPKPDTPLFSEQLTPVSTPFSGSTICGGTSAYSLQVNNPTNGVTYIWASSSSNTVYGDTTALETVVSFLPGTDFIDTLYLIATNAIQVGSCKATSVGLALSVSSGDAIIERRIVPKEPGHLLVYLDNSSDLRYHWGYDSIEVVNGNTKRLVRPQFFNGQDGQDTQVYQMFVPAARFIQPANGQDPEQLDTVHYAYWVQVIKLSPTDTCYTRVYYNGPYCTFCGNRPVEEPVSETVMASLWPNPSAGSFNVSVSGNIYGKIDSKVINAVGQTVLQRTLLKENPKQEFSFSEEEIPPGLYQLQLLGNRGEKVSVKFVVLSK